MVRPYSNYLRECFVRAHFVGETGPVCGGELRCQRFRGTEKGCPLADDEERDTGQDQWRPLLISGAAPGAGHRAASTTLLPASNGTG